jgi:hypothetical protein
LGPKRLIPGWQTRFVQGFRWKVQLWSLIRERERERETSQSKHYEEWRLGVLVERLYFRVMRVGGPLFYNGLLSLYFTME